MNKVKLSRGKLSLVTILSLGFMVLGIGCISLVMFSMWADSSHSSADLQTDETSAPGYTAEGVTVASDPLYPVYPAEGDYIGSLTIPALKQKLPIFEGDSDKEFKKGVGHFTQSVLPGEADNCVLSGHRDTFFRKIGNLKKGNQLIVQTSAGTFTYEVTGTRIVKADDKTVIVPTDHAVLTLTTCYPFYFFGSAPDRYIVSADLVKNE